MCIRDRAGAVRRISCRASADARVSLPQHGDERPACACSVSYTHLDVYKRQIETFVEHVDVIQVGARNMQNFDLLRELGKVDKPVLLKRGLSATCLLYTSAPAKRKDAFACSFFSFSAYAAQAVSR